MTFLLFVLSGSTALLHPPPPPPLYGRLLSNNKDDDLLGELDSVYHLTSIHTRAHTHIYVFVSYIFNFASDRKKSEFDELPAWTYLPSFPKKSYCFYFWK